MHPDRAAALAGALKEAAAGRFLRRVCLPHAWYLGLEFSEGGTLGFSADPEGPEVGLCPFAWPRGGAPEVLQARLKGSRVGSVSAHPGEPIVRLDFAAGGALVWEALGRSANLLLLDEAGTVLWAARHLKGPRRAGVPGERWEPPTPRPGPPPAEPAPFDAAAHIAGEGPAHLHRRLVELGRKEALAALERRERGLRRSLEGLAQDRDEGAAWAALAPLGQALLTSGDLDRRGLSALEVTDWSADPPAPVRLDLDPALSLRQNAEALFKKVRRGKARLERTAQRAREVDTALAEFDARRAALQAEEDLSRLFPARAARPAGKPVQQRRRELPPEVASVPLPGGFAGYAGKSASGNDAVSFRIGKGADFWFHAEDYPGCHVVVRNPTRLEGLPPEVERAAALYAARHSGAKAGARIAVMVSRCKFLRRVPGAPGRVMVSTSRTVLVELPRDGC